MRQGDPAVEVDAVALALTRSGSEVRFGLDCQTSEQEERQVPSKVGAIMLRSIELLDEVMLGWSSVRAGHAV